jgi:hypothetical protein
VRDVPLEQRHFRITSGRHTLVLDAVLRPDQSARARLELRPRGRTERVPADAAPSNP